MISVIIPTKDREKILKKSLSSLISALEGTSHEIIIINDGRDELDLCIDRLLVTRNVGQGAASARNTGVSHAKGETLLFLDDDIEVSRNNINRAIELLEDHPNAGVNFSWKYPSETIETLKHTTHGRFILRSGRHTNRFRIPEITNRHGVVKTKGLSSQFFCIKRKDFDITEGYDDRIPLAGVEDLILAKHLEEVGVEILLSLDDWVVHNESDRHTLDALFRRFRSGANTVRVANELGYDFINLNLAGSKKTLLKMVSTFTSVVRFSIRLIPNHKSFDSLYARLAGILLAIGTYRGYFDS